MILVISSALIVIVFATTVIVSYFNQSIDYEVTDIQLRLLTESASNLSIEEIKNGINFDASDTSGIYGGIGIIAPRSISFIRNDKTFNAIISCDIIDEIDNNFILQARAEIPEMNLEKKHKIQFKIENN